MNLQNSSANPQKTVPADYVPPMSLHRFCQITALSKASAWRYEKRGWLRTHLIANRRCVLAADVAEFNRRLASDEFAGSVSNLSAVRQIKPKKQS
jgi:hypothetical protein